MRSVLVDGHFFSLQRQLILTNHVQQCLRVFFFFEHRLRIFRHRFDYFGCKHRIYRLTHRRPYLKLMFCVKFVLLFLTLSFKTIPFNYPWEIWITKMMKQVGGIYLLITGRHENNDVVVALTETPAFSQSYRKFTSVLLDSIFIIAKKGCCAIAKCALVRNFRARRMWPIRSSTLWLAL